MFWQAPNSTHEELNDAFIGMDLVPNMTYPPLETNSSFALDKKNGTGVDGMSFWVGPFAYFQGLCSYAGISTW